MMMDFKEIKKIESGESSGGSKTKNPQSFVIKHLTIMCNYQKKGMSWDSSIWRARILGSLISLMKK